MFSVTVTDHFCIAHSLPAAAFGPAQKLHGATYVVEAEFRRPKMDQLNIVIDIGLASRFLADVCARLNYRNLDEMQEFRGQLTTTEFLARFIHGALSTMVRESFQGALKVSLRESPSARASYEGEIA